MLIPFEKMQAQGNDFIIVDGRAESWPQPTQAQIEQICHRRYGIGCDQLLWLVANDQVDARMVIYNNDGSEAENCGNGLRCVGALLCQKLNRPEVTLAIVGRRVTVAFDGTTATAHMGAAKIISVCASHVDVEIGNPHRVMFTALEEVDNSRNFEFVSGEIADTIYIDIIERGAGHTLACGSGACATAAAIWQRDNRVRPLTIQMPGGAVTVSGSPDALVLAGPVTQVFSGIIALT